MVCLSFAVSKFAQATGDLHSLSLADLKLLALSYSLEKAAHGDEHLRKHPQQVFCHMGYPVYLFVLVVICALLPCKLC